MTPINEEKSKEIQAHVYNNDVVLFMKGTAKMPYCGFSATVVQIFERLALNYKDVNILEDYELSQELTVFSDWPTFPQIYIKGEFIGGCDITREMYQSGELQELLQQKNIEFQQ